MDYHSVDSIPDHCEITEMPPLECLDNVYTENASGSMTSAMQSIQHIQDCDHLSEPSNYTPICELDREYMRESLHQSLMQSMESSFTNSPAYQEILKTCGQIGQLCEGTRKPKKSKKSKKRDRDRSDNT